MTLVFKETLRTKNNRRLVCGVGINDAWYKVNYKNKEGVVSLCPYYRRWKSMLVRCYDRNYLNKYPSYRECKVSEDWLLFSSFRKWMEKQDWQGKELDKDLLIVGNKDYNEATCTFVTKEVNYLLLNSLESEGDNPVGVSWSKSVGKFQARCSVGGVRKHLGYFVDTLTASRRYRRCKHGEILKQQKVSFEQGDVGLSEALGKWAELFHDK